MIEASLTDPPDPSNFADPSPCPASDVPLGEIGDRLRDLGIRRAVVDYSGYGDEGRVDGVVYDPGRVAVPQELDHRLQEVAETYCPDGFENNEGGSGTLTIYPFDGLAELEHRDHYDDAVDLGVRPARLPRRILRQLVALGVTQVKAHFDGYGDSGQIDSFEVEPASLSLGKELEDALEGFLLARLPGGWEIGNGAYGSFTSSPPDPQVLIEAYTRVEELSDAQITRWRWRS